MEKAKELSIPFGFSFHTQKVFIKSCVLIFTFLNRSL